MHGCSKEMLLGKEISEKKVYMNFSHVMYCGTHGFNCRYGNTVLGKGELLCDYNRFCASSIGISMWYGIISVYSVDEPRNSNS